MSKRTRARALNSYPDLLLGLYTHANCIRLCDTISELFDAAAAAGRTAHIDWDKVAELLAKEGPEEERRLWTATACEKLWSCLAFDKEIGVAHSGSTVLNIQKGTKRRRVMKLDSTGKPQKRPVRHQTAKALFLRYYRNFALADIPKSLLTKKHTRQVLTLMWQGAPTAIRQQFLDLEASERERWLRDCEVYDKFMEAVKVKEEAARAAAAVTPPTVASTTASTATAPVAPAASQPAVTHPSALAVPASAATSAPSPDQADREAAAGALAAFGSIIAAPHKVGPAPVVTKAAKAPVLPQQGQTSNAEAGTGSMATASTTCGSAASSSAESSSKPQSPQKADSVDALTQGVPPS